MHSVFIYIIASIILSAIPSMLFKSSVDNNPELVLYIFFIMAVFIIPGFLARLHQLLLKQDSNKKVYLGLLPRTVWVVYTLLFFGLVYIGDADSFELSMFFILPGFFYLLIESCFFDRNEYSGSKNVFGQSFLYNVAGVVVPFGMMILLPKYLGVANKEIIPFAAYVFLVFGALQIFLGEENRKLK